MDDINKYVVSGVICESKLDIHTNTCGLDSATDIA